MREAAFDVAGRLFGLSFASDRGRRSTIRTPAPGRCGAATGTWASSSATTSPGRRSGRAPGAPSFRGQSKLDGEVRPIAVNVCNFAKAPDGRAEPADLRRRAHAVPRDGPRAARAAVGRDLRVRLRDERRARLRRAAEPALRALAGDAGGAGGACAARRDRRADAARADGAADRGAQLRPGLRHRRVSRLGAGRPRLPRRAGAGRPDGGAGGDAGAASGCRRRSSCGTRRRTSSTSSPATATRRATIPTCGRR